MTFKEIYGDKSNEVHEGNFDCSNKNLTSLEGCYKEIHGSFRCYNKITSFKYSPDTIHDNFDCSHNQITSFEYVKYYKNLDCDLSADTYYQLMLIEYPDEVI